MRKLICIIAMLALCMSLMCPALASEDTFVPSISYKDGPEIVSVEDGYDIQHLVVTSIKGAQDKTTDIYQEDRELLLSVYQQLSEGTMVLPLDGAGSMSRTTDVKRTYVIRELVDVSFTTACRESGDAHEAKLAEEGVTLSVKFDLGVDAKTEVLVFTYIDGKWDFIESVTNHGDGTLTCVFEDICPVAFVVCNEVGNTTTGDPAGQRLILWGALMFASAGTLIVLLCKRRRHSR